MTEGLLKSIKDGKKLKSVKGRKSKRKNKSRNPQDLADMMTKPKTTNHGQMNKNRVNLIHVGSNTSNVKNGLFERIF